MRHLFTQRSGTALFPMDVATADSSCRIDDPIQDSDVCYSPNGLNSRKASIAPCSASMAAT